MLFSLRQKARHEHDDTLGCDKWRVLEHNQMLYPAFEANVWVMPSIAIVSSHLAFYTGTERVPHCKCVHLVPATMPLIHLFHTLKTLLENASRFSFACGYTVQASKQCNMLTVKQEKQSHKSTKPTV